MDILRLFSPKTLTISDNFAPILQKTDKQWHTQCTTKSEIAPKKSKCKKAQRELKPISSSYESAQIHMKAEDRTEKILFKMC